MLQSLQQGTEDSILRFYKISYYLVHIKFVVGALASTGFQTLKGRPPDEPSPLGLPAGRLNLDDTLGYTVYGMKSQERDCT